MRQHEVRSYTSAEGLPRPQQLAWKLAELATDPVGVEAPVADMVVNRLIDDAGVAAAALFRTPVANARAKRSATSCAPELRCGGTRWPRWGAG